MNVNRTTNKAITVGACCLAAAVLAPAVDAQTASGAAVIEEVIVTAQKRSENVQDVPSSVSVLGADELVNRGAQQLTDYAGYIPGFSIINTGTPGRNQLTLRGITTGPSDNSTVGVYLDDAPYGSSTSSANGGALALDLMPYDIERIEVLRGPQGTLYGASSMGGLVKYVTRAPDLYDSRLQFGGEVSGTEGSDELNRTLRVAGNAPLVDGKLALAASYFRRDIAGFIDNAATGVEDENDGEQQGGRVALLWAPSETFNVKLTAVAQNIDTEGGGAVLPVSRATGRPIHGDLTASYVLPQYVEQETRFYAATLNWDFERASLTSVTSYSTLDLDAVGDTSTGLGRFFGPGARVGLRTLVDLEKFTQELRLSSPSGQKIEWLLGAFYTTEDSSFGQTGTVMDANDVLVPGVNPVIAAVLPAHYRDFSVFGDVTYKFTDAFDVTTGVRYSKSDQDFTAATSGFLFNFPVGLPPTFMNNERGKSSEDVVTYMISPRYHVNEDVMLYARVASGYRPGGPNVSLPDTPPKFDADKLTNYEIGMKSEFFDRRVLLDISVFHIDWRDIQVQLSGSSNLGFRANAGDAVSDGVELTTVYSPSRGLRLGFNAAYTDAHVTEDVPALGARKDDAVPTVPKWNASITTDYSFAISDAIDAEAGGGYRYVGSSRYPFESNPTSYELEDYGLFDLYAGANIKGWTARFFVRNVTDERAYITVLGGAAPGQVRLTVAQPRTYGFSLDARF